MFLFEAVIKKILGEKEAYAPIKCVSAGNKGDYVILIHGIYDIPFAMKKIARALNKAGYCVINFKYKIRNNSIDTVADPLLSGIIKRRCTDTKKKINFVTHSAGGLILRRYLDENKLLQLGRVVMVSPPNQGSELATFLKKYLNFIYKFLFGPIGQQLGTDKNSYVHQVLKQNINFDLGIIAGQGSLSPFSFLLIREANDGRVSVKSTKLTGMKDHIVIPASHSLILFFDFTTRKIIKFLRDGNF
jgi:triacylglycerol lipase